MIMVLMNEWYWLYSLDVISAKHRLFREFKEHFITVGWFIFIYLAMLWVTSIDASYIALSDIINISNFYIIFLFLFLFINIAWLKQHLVDNEEMFMKAPITDHRNIIFEKMFTSTLNNIIIALSSISIYIYFSIINKTYYVPDVYMYFTLLIIIISAAPIAIISLTISKSIHNKNLLLIAVILVIYFESILNINSIYLLTILAITTFLLWILTINGYDSVPLANVVKRYKKSRNLKIPIIYFLRKKIEIKTGIDLSWNTIVRKNEHISIIISSIIILIGMIIFFHYDSLTNSIIFFPFTIYKKETIIASTIYIGAAVFSTFDGMWLLSRDGRALWQLLTVTEPFYIMISRSYILILLSLLYIPLVVVPLSVILFMNVIVVMFWCTVALSVILVLCSLGIFSSVKYLNQSIYRGGNFSIVTLYNIFFFSFVISVIVEGVAFYLFTISAIMGILCAIFLSEWGIILIIDAIYWSNKRLNEMDLII
ncbi:MAG: hypothetical protein M1481_06680 [Candidatus Thermoplasmatota archaeon]|jgi:hypothetical protein|nr:hypothetical protein [Candidatus Thermoplasmatota archaeon]